MGKNIKNYDTTQLSTFPGKGRDTLWLKKNLSISVKRQYGLTVTKLAKNPSISVKIQYGLTVTKLRLSEFKSPTFSVKRSTA